MSNNQNQLIGNRFEIHEEIGRGGMGIVYRAFDHETKRDVAIKLLNVEGADKQFYQDLVARFLREAETLRELNHPNIVKLLESVEENDKYYLIIEYVSGGDLQKLLETERTLPIERVLKIAIELADALTRAHYKGVIHRDLKPANVLIAKDGSPHLTDFGIAHVITGKRITQEGASLGTLAYMSPEAFRGNIPDKRTDIWAFGVMLYEMIADIHPFEHPRERLGSAILSPDIQPTYLLHQKPDLNPKLALLIHRMIVKDSEKRISSMREVSLELEKVMQGDTEIDTLIAYNAGVLPFMNTLNQEIDIFISHASEDNDIVTKIVQEFERYDIKVWVDLQGINPGNNWLQKIEQAMVLCKVGLFVLSPDSTSSEWCQRELLFLENLNKYIYMVLHKQARIPFIMVNRQFIDLRDDFEGSIRRIVEDYRKSTDIAKNDQKQNESKVQHKDSDLSDEPHQRRITSAPDTDIKRLAQTQIVGYDKKLPTIIKLLQEEIVSIVGFSGIGKTRLASEIALTSPDIHGVIWHTCSDTTQADAIIQLLREHFSLDGKVSEEDVFEELAKPIRHTVKIRHLVVIDNLSAVPTGGVRQRGYLEMIDKLHEYSAEVLITSRAAWVDINPKHHRVKSLGLLDKAAAHGMINNFAVSLKRKNLSDKHRDELYRVSFGHPGLIEQSMKRLENVSIHVILDDLRDLKNANKAQDKIKEIYLKDLKAISKDGIQCEFLLRRVLVCHGGFDYQAGIAISGLDAAIFEKALGILIQRTFIEYQDDNRYFVNEMVMHSLEPDKSAFEPMIKHFSKFAKENFMQYKVLQSEWTNILHALELGFNNEDIMEYVPLIHWTYSYMRIQAMYDLAIRHLKAAEKRSEKSLIFMKERIEARKSKLEELAQIAVGIARIEIAQLEPSKRSEVIKYLNPLIERGKNENATAAQSHLYWVRGISFMSLRPRNYEKAQADYEKALEFAEANQQNYRLAHIRQSLGSLHAQLDNFKEAENHWEKTKELKEANNIHDVDRFLELNSGVLKLELGKVESGKQNDEQAQVHYKEGEKILEKSLLRAENEHDNQVIMIACVNLAEIKLLQKEFHTAEIIARNGLVFAKHMKWSEGILRIFLQLKEALDKQGNQAGIEALLESAREDKLTKKVLACIIENLDGELFFDADRFDDAEKVFVKQLTLAEDSISEYCRALSHFGLARILYRKGLKDEALEHLTQAQTLLKSRNIPEDFTKERVADFMLKLDKT